MAITWTTSGGRPQPGRYTIESADNPTLGWATGQLTQIHENVFDYMEQSKVYAEQAVAARSRVDTGLMRRLADAVLTVRTDVSVLDFGWWEDSPYYAPFQEFGTRAGIQAMLAVYETHLEIMAGFPDAVVGR